MGTHRVMVVDDDRKTVDLIRLYLEREGYHVFVAYDGRDALDLIRQKRPDLVVLDLMLPTVSGLDICRILSLEMRIPLIMLTAKTTEEDVLLGLDLGADDYVTKPFSPRQLVARVRAVLRRANDATIQSRSSLRFGELEIDPTSHEVHLRGEPVYLTPREFKMLETLVREPGRAFTRCELLERVFGYDYKGLERTVDAHIMNLRKKLSLEHETGQGSGQGGGNISGDKNGSEYEYIQTVYGIGYKFAWSESDVRPHYASSPSYSLQVGAL